MALTSTERPAVIVAKRRGWLARSVSLGPLFLLLVAGLAIAGLSLPESYFLPDYSAIERPPSLAHPFGTDALGRDVLLRIALGAPTSLMVGLLVAGVSAVLGIAGGSLAGYLGGWVDALISRITDYFLTIPPFFFVLVAVAILGASTVGSSVIIGVALSAATARQVRAQFLSLRHREFVAAARLIGMSTPAVIFREILPNAIQPAVVQSALNAASGVLIHAGLGFLGLADPNIAEWGGLISENFARGLSAWWAIIAPGIAVTILVVGFTSLGDQFNRYFDIARRY